MKDRIVKFMEVEKLSPAQFADAIGVQRSNISHILSERNKPGLDFIDKMLTTYPQLSAEWLIKGEGTMYKEPQEQSLFSNEQLSKLSEQAKDVNKVNYSAENIEQKVITENKQPLENFSEKIEIRATGKDENKKIERIIICYTDKTFDFYLPE